MSCVVKTHPSEPNNPSKYTHRVFQIVSDIHDENRIAPTPTCFAGALRFATIPAPVLAEHQHFSALSASPPAVMIVAEDTARVEFTEEKSAFEKKDALKAWVNVHALPPFGQIDAKNYHAYRRSGLPLGMILLATRWGNETEIDWSEKLQAPAFLELGRRFRGRLVLGHTEARSAGLSKEMLTGLKLPAWVIHDVKNKAFHLLPPGRDHTKPSEIQGFSESFLQGTTLDHEAATTHIPGQIRHLRDLESYSSLVKNLEKDTVVAFHVSWSQNSRPLIPEIRKLALAVEFVPTVAVAALEVSSGGLPSSIRNLVGVTGFNATDLPVLVLLKPGDAKHPVKYKGPLSAARLLGLSEVEVPL